MVFNVQTFKSHLEKTGTLPTNKFEVDIPVPRVLFNSEVIVDNYRRPQPNFGEMLSFRAESVRVPGVTMQLTPVNRYGYGPIQRFPYNANFTDSAMTFIADKDSLIWIFFYNWLNNVFLYNSTDTLNTESYITYRSNYMIDYAVNTKINVYDNDGKPSTTVELIDSYPISLNDIALGWSDNNQLKRITVSFAFRHWRFTNVTTTDNSTKTSGPAQLVIPPKGQTVSQGVISLPTMATAGPNQLGDFNKMSKADQSGLATIMGIQGTR